jgi:hypothetical protein
MPYKGPRLQQRISRLVRKDLKDEPTGGNNYLISTSSGSHHDCISIAILNHTLADQFNLFFSFACNASLSGENVAFLRLVQRWKEAWNMLGEPAVTDFVWRQLFNVAVQMYHDFIDPATAQVVGLNLEFGLSDMLKEILGNAAQTIPLSLETAGAEHGVVAPFNDNDVSGKRMAEYHNTLFAFWEYVKDYTPFVIPASSSNTNGHGSNNQANSHVNAMSHETPADSAISLAQYSPQPVHGNNNNNNNTLLPQGTHEQTLMTASRYPMSIMHMQTRVLPDTVIPENFTVDIFDNIETSVYLMVLRDTFPKYMDWKMQQYEQLPPEQNKLKAFLSKMKSVFSRN